MATDGIAGARSVRLPSPRRLRAARRAATPTRGRPVQASGSRHHARCGCTPGLPRRLRISAGRAFAFTDDGPAEALSVDAALAFRVGGP